MRRSGGTRRTRSQPQPAQPFIRYPLLLTIALASLALMASQFFTCCSFAVSHALCTCTHVLCIRFSHVFMRCCSCTHAPAPAIHIPINAPATPRQRWSVPVVRYQRCPVSVCVPTTHGQACAALDSPLCLSSECERLPHPPLMDSLAALARMMVAASLAPFELAVAGERSMCLPRPPWRGWVCTLFPVHFRGYRLCRTPLFSI